MVPRRRSIDKEREELKMLKERVVQLEINRKKVNKDPMFKKRVERLDLKISKIHERIEVLETEVRRHYRKTKKGKTTVVREYTKKTAPAKPKPKKKSGKRRLPEGYISPALLKPKEEFTTPEAARKIDRQWKATNKKINALIKEKGYERRKEAMANDPEIKKMVEENRALKRQYFALVKEFQEREKKGKLFNPEDPESQFVGRTIGKTFKKPVTTIENKLKEARSILKTGDVNAIKKFLLKNKPKNESDNYLIGWTIINLPDNIKSELTDFINTNIKPVIDKKPKEKSKVDKKNLTKQLIDAKRSLNEARRNKDKGEIAFWTQKIKGLVNMLKEKKLTEEKGPIGEVARKVERVQSKIKGAKKPAPKKTKQKKLI